MKKLAQGSFVIAIVFLSSIVLAGNITDTSFNKLMALSGINKEIAELPGMIIAGIEQAKQQGAPISDAAFGEMQEPMKSVFRPSEILNIIGKEIRNNISESEAKDLLAWYESDLGRVITKAEENASTPAAYQEMIKKAQSLLADEQGVNIAKRIDMLLNATDMAMQLQENAGIAVSSVISTIMNPSQSINIEDFKTQMFAQEQQSRKKIEQLVILFFVYSYKDINKANIEKYIKFLERPNTKKFNNSVAKGMEYAFNHSIDTMAKSLADAFKKNNKKVNKANSDDAKNRAAD